MRKLRDIAVLLLAGGSAAIACGLLVWLAGTILHRGLPAIDFEFLFAPMRAGGAEGGLRYHLIGTGILLVTAAAVCAPLALALALTRGFFLQGDAARRRLDLCLYTLNGVPSILFGLAGLMFFVHFLGWGKSWLSGGILLGVMILPTATVALVERIKSLPSHYVEAALGLGLSPSQVVRSVILRQCIGGLFTGMLLGLARAAGETAPILFTATLFSGVTIPDGVADNPVLTLPYHVFVLAQDSFDPNATQRVWGTATVLLLGVFTLSALALPLRLRSHEEARHA